MFLLKKDKLTIGLVQLVHNEADNDSQLANGNTVAHIHGLQIAKSHQRKGHALDLMKKLEEYSEGIEIKKLTLGVDGDNSYAINLYEKIGYTLFKETEGRESNIKLLYLFKDL